MVIKIFLPFPASNKEIFFCGIITSMKDTTNIFITKYWKPSIELENDCINKEDTIYGYYSNISNYKEVTSRHKHQLLLQKHHGHFQVNKIVINNHQMEKSNVIIMIYDIHKLRNSETLNVNCDELLILRELLQKDYNIAQRTSEFKSVYEAPSILISSMFVQHCYNLLNLLRWIYSTIKKSEKISIKQGNVILALIVDVILGYYVLNILLFDRKEIGELLLGILEKLVNSMYSLLKWLMGAPAGLKLNNAFNKMLGKYFSYHVELWWLFLDVSGERLDFILHIYQYLGYFGITFQAAIVSDMLCITTFHSYCIYVYAARLFNIQISGLIALLRLFVGRKYNPLRCSIDSCEYTNQELFVGTVAFTILLLLLPTTVMYYIVFTMFRVLSLFVQYILARFIHLVQTLPLYAISLWITRSPKLAGNILIEEEEGNEFSHLILKIRLLNKPLGEVMKNFKPTIEMPKSIDWKNIVSSVFTGKQII